ncbi:MAG: cytochrome P450 [Hyphomicrobiaceae bacterium]
MSTIGEVETGGGLYPPSVTTPNGPLPIWRFLPKFLANPLRTLPRQVYEEPLYSPPWLGGRMAWVTDPDLVERILLGEHEHFPKSPIENRIFTSILGEGILTSEGASWRWQRRIVAPLFRHQEILGFIPTMSEVADRLVQSWRGQAAGGKRRIDLDMADVTFDVLAGTIFAGARAEEGQALKHHIGAYLGHTSWDVAFELLQLPAWVWHPAKPAMRRHARRLKATMARILDRERRAGFPGGGLMAKLGAAKDPETGEGMSDELMCNNLLTFAAAGHETTAKALTWTLYLLARAPDWQHRLREEVRAAAGDGPIGAQHIEQLELTRRVLKEGMRLYPPAPVLGRKATEVVTLGGQQFQPGAMMILPVWAIHRHRALWEDPDRFDPDRFAPEREATMRRAQFMPFGFGPRTCIGMSFAMMEATVLLAAFVRGCRFDWVDQLSPEPVSRVTLRPRGGMTLGVSPA